MNAPGAHYVANADAKIQLFSVTAITFQHFFVKQPFSSCKSGLIFKHLHTKSPQTTIFSLFLYNFAVAKRLLMYRGADALKINKK